MTEEQNKSPPLTWFERQYGKFTGLSHQELEFRVTRMALSLFDELNFGETIETVDGTVSQNDEFSVWTGAAHKEFIEMMAYCRALRKSHDAIAKAQGAAMKAGQNKRLPRRQAILALERGIAAQSETTKHQKLCEALNALKGEAAGDATHLLEIVFEHHLYNATNFSYLDSPLARKSHDVLVRAGILDERGYLNSAAAAVVDFIAKARGRNERILSAYVLREQSRSLFFEPARRLGTCDLTSLAYGPCAATQPR